MGSGLTGLDNDFSSGNLASVGSLALYCPRCGKIQLRDIPLFSGKEESVLRCENCSHPVAYAKARPKEGLLLRTHCGACGEETQHTFPWRQLRRTRFEKLYCAHDRFELGYIGKWQDIAEFLDFNAAEYDALHPADEEGFIERQQLLLEALNRVHELALREGLSCPCGSHDIMAGLLGDCVVIECAACTAFAVLPIREVKDLEKLLPGSMGDLPWQQYPLLDVWGK